MKQGDLVKVVSAATERGKQFIGRSGQVGRIMMQGSNMIRVDFAKSGSCVFDRSEVKRIKRQ